MTSTCLEHKTRHNPGWKRSHIILYECQIHRITLYLLTLSTWVNMYLEWSCKHFCKQMATRVELEMVNMVSRSMNGLFTDLCVTVVLSWISHKIAYSFPVPQPKCIESHAFWRNIFIFIEHTNFSRGMLSSILPLKKYIVKLTKIRILLQKLFQIVMSYDIILSMLSL